MTSTSDLSVRAVQPAPPKVFLSLQAGRGIAALMVVFYHCEGLFSLSKYWHRTHHYFYFGASGVDFFFVLSGIVIFYAHHADIGRPKRLADYAWKRFRRIYPIYWIVLLIAVPIYIAVPTFGDGSQRNPSVIFSSIVLLPFTRTETIVPVAWTLFHEIMFYLFFGLLLVRRRIGVAALTLWMAASIVALFLPIPSSSIAAALLFWISPLHLLFGLGIWIAIIVRRRSFNGLPLAVAGTAAFLACGCFEDVVRPSTQLLPLVFGFLAAMASAGLMQLEKAGRLRVPDFLVFLGNASYSLYLVHYFALSLAAKVLYPLWVRHPTPIFVPFSVLIIVALGAGLALHLLVERPLLARLPRKLS